MRSEAAGGQGGFPVKTLGLDGLWADRGRHSQAPQGTVPSQNTSLCCLWSLSGQPCAFCNPSLGQGLVSVVSLSNICKVSNNRKSLSLPLWTTDQYKRLRQSGE